MGNEFAQTSEWDCKTELNWFLLDFDCHKMMQQCVKDLNYLYRTEPALYELQFDPKGFEWIDLGHSQESIVVYKRKGKNKKDSVLVILNLTPVVRNDWKMQLIGKQSYKEIFNSDYKKYWGTGDVFNPDIPCRLLNKKNNIYEINVHLPALGAIILR
jgi:1,4-alpha-glucan branching enzyme